MSLTPEELRAFFDKIANEPIRPHEHGPFHPEALTRDGSYPCSCGPVPIRNGRIDWEWGVAQMTKTEETP